MLGGGRTRLAESWVGMCGNVCEWKWLGDMAFVWQGVRSKVKVP